MNVPLKLVAVVFLAAGVGALVWQQQRRTDSAAAIEGERLDAKGESSKSDPTLLNAKSEPADAVREPVARNISPPEPAKPGTPKSALLKDPETRALMQKQQEQALTKHAEKIINKDFIRDWNLGSEQAAQVKDAFREKTAAGKDLLAAMMFDGLDDAALAERGRETKRRIEESNAELRRLLGPAGFDALTEKDRFQETSDRAKRLRDELAAAEQSLSKAQYESLIEAMNVERQGFSFRVDFNDPLKCDLEHIRDHFSESNFQMYFEDMQQLNARIAERAALFLTPAQSEQLQAAQSSQLEQSRLTVKMTTELFNRRKE
jgi:hypothetical protein